MIMPRSHQALRKTTWCYPSRWTNIWGSRCCIWTLQAQIWLTPGFQPSSLSVSLPPSISIHPFPPVYSTPLSFRLPTDKLLIRCHGRGGFYLLPTLLIKHERKESQKRSVCFFEGCELTLGWTASQCGLIKWIEGWMRGWKTCTWDVSVTVTSIGNDTDARLGWKFQIHLWYGHGQKFMQKNGCSRGSIGFFGAFKLSHKVH